MMIPDDLRYSDKHEWVKADGDIATVGITDYAQTQLGDIVYVELPSVGTKVEAAASFGTIEAVKAVSDLYCPVSGEVVEVNDNVTADPAVIKSSPYGDGWMVKVRMDKKEELDSLLSAGKYRELTGE
ncbi:MAG: glycine cleavage system protein GcvH [Candidatus Eisenbacteria bacterium]